MKKPNYFKRNAAHDFVDKGFPIIALNGKKPVKVINGSRDATHDHDVANDLWIGHPYRNIGICTSDEYGIAVLDIDRKRGSDRVVSLEQYFDNEIRINVETSTTCQAPACDSKNDRYSMQVSFDFIETIAKYGKPNDERDPR